MTGKEYLSFNQAPCASYLGSKGNRLGGIPHESDMKAFEKLSNRQCLFVTQHTGSNWDWICPHNPQTFLWLGFRSYQQITLQLLLFCKKKFQKMFLKVAGVFVLSLYVNTVFHILIITIATVFRHINLQLTAIQIDIHRKVPQMACYGTTLPGLTPSTWRTTERKGWHCLTLMSGTCSPHYTC